MNVIYHIKFMAFNGADWVIAQDTLKPIEAESMVGNIVRNGGIIISMEAVVPR